MRMTKAVVEKFFNKIPKGRCNPCEYAKCIKADGGYLYLGCTHESCGGTWVMSIKNCPIGKKEKTPFEVR